PESPARASFRKCVDATRIGRWASALSDGDRKLEALARWIVRKRRGVKAERHGRLSLRAGEVSPVLVGLHRVGVRMPVAPVDELEDLSAGLARQAPEIRRIALLATV